MHEPTMADIAAHLGISRQLVSIVLRDMPGASQETRKRVREAAVTLGYSPHMAARTLRQYRSRHIGVAFTPAHATEPEIVEAIYPAAAQHGYRVILSAQTSTRNTKQAVAELIEYRCAALIVISPDLTPAETKALAHRVKAPLTVVGFSNRNHSYDVVTSAGDTGIALVVRHLVELGHRAITYVHNEAMPPGAPRLAGYRQAVADAGLTEDIVSVDDPDYTEESGSSAGRQILARGSMPTAVVTGNDQVALGVMTVLSRAGVAIPEQVSLAGFDDSRVARLTSVDLTSARQDPTELAEAAIAAAVRRINDPHLRPTTFVLAPVLVVRSSTAAASL